jgi:hypothetical protein
VIATIAAPPATTAAAVAFTTVAPAFLTFELKFVIACYVLLNSFCACSASAVILIFSSSAINY